MAEVKSGSGYLCQNALALHFGLGDHTIIDKIIVTFPSGRAHKIETAPVNQIIQIYRAQREVTSKNGCNNL